MAIRHDTLFGFFAGLIGLALLFVVSSVFCGCASQSSKLEDSNNYRAQIQLQTYLCPSCGFPILDKDVSPNIRVKNTCPFCGEVFFGKPMTAKKEKTANYAPYGPRNYGPTSVFQTDLDHQYFDIGGYFFNETQTGFSEGYWHFGDRKTKIFRVTPRWTTTRYHLGGR